MEFLGFNNLPTRWSFQQRALYKECALTGEDQKLNLTDFWYKNPLYGKVDPQGRVVIPNEDFLTPVFDNNGVYALDFVAEAYQDFKRSFLSHLIDNGGTKNYNSYLVNFIASKGWQSSDVTFNDHQQGLYDALYNLMNENLVFRRKACNFAKFLDVYWWFTSQALKNAIPITQAGFIKSKFCSPNMSGLIIEIMPDETFGDDIAIQRKFLNDPLFSLYVSKAAQFGFSIDKNAPWRLVARITSPQMRYYMKLKNKSWKEFFSDYYIPISFSDFEDFQVSARQFYNSFREAFPEDGQVILTDNQETGLMRIKTIRRPIAPFYDDGDLSELKWLKKYYVSRLAEDGTNLSPIVLKREMKKIKRSYWKGSLDDAFETMELKCGLAKLPNLAFKKFRQAAFNNGSYDPESGLYTPSETPAKKIPSTKTPRKKVSWKKKAIEMSPTPY
jgi:hypothetical protein